MGKHVCKNGFTIDYTWWIYHGEVDRMREKVARQCNVDYNADARVEDMLVDYHEAHFGEGCRDEELEATAKGVLHMLYMRQ